MNFGNNNLDVFDTMVKQPQWYQKVEAWNIILKSWSYLGKIRLPLDPRIYTSWREVNVEPIKRHYNHL